MLRLSGHGRKRGLPLVLGWFLSVACCLIRVQPSPATVKTQSRVHRPRFCASNAHRHVAPQCQISQVHIGLENDGGGYNVWPLCAFA